MRQAKLSSPITEEDLSLISTKPSTSDPLVVSTVQRIISEVKQDGDDRLVELSREFDGCDLEAAGLKVTDDEMSSARSQVGAKFAVAVKSSVERIARYHEHEIQSSWQLEEPGFTAGERLSAVDIAGVYVPGGKAAYPSTAIMAVVAAKTAGVPNVIICTPPRPDGAIDPHVLYAADVAGADAVYKAGGAGAIAAMAYGTVTIPRVDVIVGPGNIFVAAAQREVVGQVGIDSLAGPSEVVVFCDESAPLNFVAADLVAQVEHGSGATAVLVALSDSVVDGVSDQIEQLLTARGDSFNVGREEVAERLCGVVVSSRETAIELINAVAPEHVELLIQDPLTVSEEIKHAGTILIGPYASAAISDYSAGPNHVLPTGGSARFASPLGVHTFTKRTSVLWFDEHGVGPVARMASEIAKAEGLMAHAYAAELRVGDDHSDS